MLLKYVPGLVNQLNRNVAQIGSLLPTSATNLLAARNQSFFNKLSAEELWRGSTSVSNAGRKRGRGKASGKQNIRDLNKGQVIGVGKYNISFPGLSGKIIDGQNVGKRTKVPEDPEREARLLKLRETGTGFKRFKVHPLERGWTGGKMPGRSIGVPDAIAETDITSFDTRVLDHKLVFVMKGNVGRKRRYSVTSITGNGKGVAGFATAKGNEVRGALRKSKNRAAQKLMTVKIFENRTIYHVIFAQFGSTRIYMLPKPEGYGLVCHRAIKTMCQVVGIKDLYAKIEGSTNILHIIKAFFIGLLNQRTHDQLAEEKGLHVVNLRPEYNGLPQILASPNVCRNASQILPNENLDFTLHLMEGRVLLRKRKFPPFFVNTKGYEIYLKDRDFQRARPILRVRQEAEAQDD